MNRHGWCLARCGDGSADFWFHEGTMLLPPVVSASISRELSQGRGVRVTPLSSFYGAHRPRYQVRVRLNAGRTA